MTVSDDYGRAIALAARLPRKHKALADRLITNRDNESRLLSAIHEAQAVLELEQDKAWVPSAHPRAPAGAAGGGQFVSAGTSSTTTTRAATAGARKRLGKPLTAANIRAYQRQHGLQVDGKIGRQTAAQLLGSSDAKKLKPGAMTAQQRRGLEALAHKGFDPREARDPGGRWTDSGGGGGLGRAIRALKPGEAVHEGGTYVSRLKSPDLDGNEYEAGVRGFDATRHRTAEQAYGHATRMGMGKRRAA
jgi:hypothetical protein